MVILDQNKLFAVDNNSTRTLFTLFMFSLITYCKMDIEKACDIEKGSIKVQKENVSEYTYIVLNILGLYVCYLASTVVQEEIYSYRSS